MTDRDDAPREESDDLRSDVLARAVELLRDAPKVREEWRRALLARAASRERTRSMGRRWWIACAAGLVGALMGSGTTYLLLRGRPVGGVPAGATTATTVSRRSEGRPAPVRFSLIAPGAVHVSIAGDFNHWSAATLPMRRLEDGRTWEVEVPLLPGRYTYAFVVDGHLAADPSAPTAASDDFGISSSVLIVNRP